jgi:Ca2+/Na+ antiporter
MIISTVWKAHMSVLMMIISMVRKGRVMLALGGIGGSS